MKKRLVVLLLMVVMISGVGVATISACCRRGPSPDYELVEWTCAYVNGELVYSRCVWQRKA